MVILCDTTKERQYLSVASYTLNKLIDAPILAIGVQEGRTGYKLLKSNLNQIFTIKADSGKWYYDGFNIKAELETNGITTTYEFRRVRLDRNADNLLTAIEEGRANRKLINHYTRSLKGVLKALEL